jgi:ABC-type multidrug transport system fused ATPase/permease subunit
VLDPFWDSFYNKGKTSLFSVIARKYGWMVFLNVFVLGLSVACALTIPTFMEDIIVFLTPLPPGVPRPALTIDNGYALTGVLFLLQIFSTIFAVTSNQIGYQIQIDMRTILISAVYEKSLRLTQQSSRKFTQGQILNIINVDVEKIAMLFMQFNQLCVAPVQVTVSIILLGRLIGFAVWGGAGALFGILILQIGAIGFLSKFQKQFLEFGDKRLKLLREVLYGIKIIKFRALEDFFFNRLSAIRSSQLQALKKYYMLQVYFVGLIQIAPISMPILAFLVYAAINGSIIPQVIFPALTLFQGLFQPILTVPQSVTALVVALVSWKRINEFLNAEEAERLRNTVNEKSHEGEAIQVQNASFEWEYVDNESEAENKVKGKKRKGEIKPINPSEHISPEERVDRKGFVLQEFSMSIRPGTKAAIIGAVGSGNLQD